MQIEQMYWCFWLMYNKQSRTADEGWSSSLGVGRGANNPSLLKKNVQ